MRHPDVTRRATVRIGIHRAHSNNHVRPVGPFGDEMRSAVRAEVSAFAGREKKRSGMSRTATFLGLSTGAEHISDEDVAVLERFTILLYDRTSSLTDIDEARLELYTKKGRIMENLPPTKAALVQHVKRAVYQGGHC